MAKVLKNLLSDYGYNLVALPKQDIAPLLLLYKNEDAVSSVESNLNTLFKTTDSAPPVIRKNTSVSSIQGESTVILDADTGVSMLGYLLEKLNMGKLSGKLNLGVNHTVHISYENVLEDKVDLLDLDTFISNSEPDGGGFSTFRKKLENSELYVVNSVLKSNSFSVVVEDEHSNSVDLAATVKGIVDTTVDVSFRKNNSISLTQHGSQALVFAFKAQQIIYNAKNWWQLFNKDQAQFHIRDQKGVILKSETDFPTHSLKLNTGMLDF